jgi:hypothetical protein
MKKQSLKKLSLSRTTVSNLDKARQAGIRGGDLIVINGDAVDDVLDWFSRRFTCGRVTGCASCVNTCDACPSDPVVCPTGSALCPQTQYPNCTIA